MLKVRLATPGDRDEVLRLVRGLLIELGGNPAPADELQGCSANWWPGETPGSLLSQKREAPPKQPARRPFLKAIRTAGRYAILQEMYVEPESRSSGVGRAVIEFALEHAVASGCQVGSWALPATASVRSSSMSGRALLMSARACAGRPATTATVS